MLKSEEDIKNLIQEDEWMMAVLRVAKSLNLPDWWICAGFVRSKIWDTLHGFTERTQIGDVDVIYFDENDMNELTEKRWEDKLKNMLPNIPWSVKNEARMHLVSHFPPYSSSIDAIAKFPETVTALGVKLDKQEQVIFKAPWGIEDVVKLAVKPTPYFTTSSERIAIYEKRIRNKKWQQIWPNLTIYHN